jgi:putative transposase
MNVSLTTSVLNEALSLYPKPEIFNTDQGSQYTAKEHVEILVDSKIVISVDAKSRSIENIVIERFWRKIKYEDVYPASYQDIKEARKEIGESINLYNSERLHAAIDYFTPDEVYYHCASDRCYNAKEKLLNCDLTESMCALTI